MAEVGQGQPEQWSAGRRRGNLSMRRCPREVLEKTRSRKGVAPSENQKVPFIAGHLLENETFGGRSLAEKGQG